MNEKRCLEKRDADFEPSGPSPRERTEAEKFEREVGGLIDSVGGVYWTAEFGGLRMKFISQQAERVFGYPVSDWLGQDDFWQDHIHPLDRAYVVEQSFAATRRGVGHRLVYRMIAADGRTVWIDDMVNVIFKDGEPYNLHGLMVDVTASVEIKALLNVERNLLELIASGTPLEKSLEALALAIENHQGDIRCSILLADENETVLMHGAAPSLPDVYVEAIDGLPIADNVGSCGTAAFRRQLIVVEDIAEDALWSDFQELALRSSLRACWSSPIVDAQGKLLGTFGIYKDEPGRPTAEHLRLIELATQIAIVAIRKDRTESSLRTSERELRLVLDNIPGMVAWVDRDLRYQYVNEQYDREFGSPGETIVGRRLPDVIGTELFAQTESHYRQVLAGHRVSLESCSVSNSPLERSWLINLVPESDVDSNVIGFFFMAFDVSATKRSNEQRDEAIRLLRRVAGEIPGFVYQYRLRPDGTSCFPYVSERIREIFGMDPEELVDDCSQIFELHHPDDRKRIADSIVESAQNLTPWSQEYRLQHEDGRISWVHANANPNRDADGSTLWHGYLADITARKNAEAESAVKAQLLELSGEMAKVGGWEIDLSTNRLSWTKETYRIHELNFDAELSIDRAIEFYAPVARPVIQAAVQAGIEHGTPWNLELPLITAKGNQIWVRVHGVPFVECGRVVKLIGAFQDITDSKNAETSRLQLENQLRESQKLEAVGTLAGGIAHDFNNILTIILGNADLGRMDLLNAHHAGVEKSLSEIKKAGERARDLVRQVLSFSRKQPTHLKPTDISPFVEESIRLLRATIPSSVIIASDLEKNIPTIRAVGSLIQQVVVNLATNSLQALRNRQGCINIRLSSVMIHDELRVRLMVSDNGCGMDSGVLSRIFEPFFTTKAVGQGTGLGLSVVHGIVRSHEGDIHVDSTPGVGTTFTIDFPTMSNATATVSDLEQFDPIDFDPIKKSQRGENVTARVLLIDDDMAVLRSIQRILENAGCRVEAYSEPLEAMERLRHAPTRFDGVMVDSNMPGPSGIEIVRLVRSIRDDLPVAIMSGFIDEDLLWMAEALGVRNVLQKPCSQSDLMEIIVHWSSIRS